MSYHPSPDEGQQGLGVLGSSKDKKEVEKGFIFNLTAFPVGLDAKWMGRKKKESEHHTMYLN